MTCLVPRCSNPRSHDLPCCPSHWEWVEGKLKTKFLYALRQVQHCEELNGPRFDRRVIALKEARQEIQELFTHKEGL